MFITPRIVCHASLSPPGSYLHCPWPVLGPLDCTVNIVNIVRTVMIVSIVNIVSTVIIVNIVNIVSILSALTQCSQLFMRELQMSLRPQLKDSGHYCADNISITELLIILCLNLWKAYNSPVWFSCQMVANEILSLYSISL